MVSRFSPIHTKKGESKSKQHYLTSHSLCLQKIVWDLSVLLTEPQNRSPVSFLINTAEAEEESRWNTGNWDHTNPQDVCVSSVSPTAFLFWSELNVKDHGNGHLLQVSHFLHEGLSTLTKASWCKNRTQLKSSHGIASCHIGLHCIMSCYCTLQYDASEWHSG